LRRVLSSLFTLICLSFFLLIIPASGQNAPSIEQLEIALWPEYDRAAVLVIYRVFLAEDTSLPTQVSLPIPEEVGEPFAVAWQDAEEGLIVANYDREVSGDWATISLETESLLIQLEFYQDLSFDGTQRNFSFHWPGGYSAEKLIYELQEPFEASEVNVDPPSTSSGPAADGLNYYRADLGPLFPTSEFTIEFSYVKSSNTLSVDAVAPPVPFPTSPSVTPSGGTPDVSEFLPWIVGGAGGLLILVAAVLFIRNRREQSKLKPRRKPRRGGQKPAEQRPPELEASPVFCHNCGAKASASDFYCRRCGTQLRR
jgi:hypothetical protein